MSMENTLRANERLREERLRRGWSQQKLADELGIAVVTVNRWERGKQQPTGYYRLRLSALFEKSEEELGLGEETADPEEVIYTEEQQESIRETVSVPQEVAEELVAVPSHSYDPVLQRPAGEERRAHLSLPFAYNWSDRSLQYKRGRTILLLMVLALLIISASITFFLMRPSTGRKSAPVRVSTQNVSVPIALRSIEAGTPTIYDPLTKAGGDSEWEAGGPGCVFTHNGLQMNMMGTTYCSANVREFDNMVFKIDMSLQQGKWAGVTFRADSDSNLYYFTISASGQYELDLFKPHIKPPFILLSSRSAKIHPGYNEWNEITVEANGSHLSFWVNGTLIAEKDDPNRTHGYVGSCVGSYNTLLDPEASNVVTVATFRNAYVWAL